MKKTADEKLLTDVELELMTILWRIGEGSVNDVIKHLPAHRDLAYTSVSTMLRILEQKQVLRNRKEGRGHIYMPVLSKSEYEARAVKNVVDRVFEGTPVALVRQLLDTFSMEKTDLEALKEMIARAEADQ